jgi:hypothetical protein
MGIVRFALTFPRTFFLLSISSVNAPPAPSDSTKPKSSARNADTKLSRPPLNIKSFERTISGLAAPSPERLLRRKVQKNSL